MTPADAVDALKSLHWSEDRIARAIGVTQMAVNKYRKGSQPSYERGLALIALARKEMRRATRNAAHETTTKTR